MDADVATTVVAVTSMTATAGIVAAQAVTK